VIENVSKNTFAIKFDGSVRALDRLIEVVDAAKPAHLIWNIHLKAPAVSTELFLSGMQCDQHSRIPMTELEPEKTFSTDIAIGLVATETGICQREQELQNRSKQQSSVLLGMNQNEEYSRTTLQQLLN